MKIIIGRLEFSSCRWTSLLIQHPSAELLLCRAHGGEGLASEQDHIKTLGCAGEKLSAVDCRALGLIAASKLAREEVPLTRPGQCEPTACAHCLLQAERSL